MSAAWPRRNVSRWLAGTTALALVLLASWLALRPEPLREYIPWCGSSHEPILIEGEIRERFLLLMSEVFDSFGVERVVRDGRIFLRGEGSSEGLRWPLVDIEMNFQHRVVGAIAEGVTIDDTYFPPPPALVEAVRASERFFGPFPRRDEKGRPILGADPRFESCHMMRAAILKNP